MDDGRILLGKVGEWFWSKFYFDTKDNSFVEEKYREEWVDTGTIYLGDSVVTAQHVYEAFVEAANTEGIKKLLEFCDENEIQKTSDEGISEQEFRNNLKGIAPFLRLNKVASTYIVKDSKTADILCVITETPYFFSCELSYHSPSEKGFKDKGEAFLYAIKHLKAYCSEIKVKAENKNKEEKSAPSKITVSTKKTINWEMIKKLSSKIALISTCILLLGFRFFSNFSGMVGEIFAIFYAIDVICVVSSLIALLISSFAIYMNK